MESTKFYSFYVLRGKFCAVEEFTSRMFTKIDQHALHRAKGEQVGHFPPRVLVYITSLFEICDFNSNICPMQAK